MNLIEFGDCRETMRRWAAQGIKAQMCVTSPPYYGLRSYLPNEHPDKALEIGLEETPDEYVARMVDVFRAARDVLADDGTLWLNLGDSYAGAGYSNHANTGGAQRQDGGKQKHLTGTGLKPKDLIGIPWRVAFALQADGWYLRQDIIWHKPNPMPESVRDRCTKAHEYIFLLSKSERYYFDHEAIKEPSVTNDPRRPYTSAGAKQLDGRAEWKSGQRRDGDDFTKRNRRSVWTATTRPYKGAHFATFPPALIEPCILAGSRPGDIVLDPFMGSGTTAAVAIQHGRQYLGCELNPEYGPLQQERIAAATARIERGLCRTRSTSKPAHTGRRDDGAG